MKATLRFPAHISRMYVERGARPFIRQVDVKTYASARELAYAVAEEMNMPIELVYDTSSFVAYPAKLRARGY